MFLKQIWADEYNESNQPVRNEYKHYFDQIFSNLHDAHQGSTDAKYNPTYDTMPTELKNFYTSNNIKFT